MTGSALIAGCLIVPWPQQPDASLTRYREGQTLAPTTNGRNGRYQGKWFMRSRRIMRQRLLAALGGVSATVIMQRPTDAITLPTSPQAWDSPTRDTPENTAGALG
jgi:hypothetical protein